MKPSRPLRKFVPMEGLRQEALEAIREYIVLPITNSNLFRSIRSNASTGVLISGVGGVGKSLLLESITKELPNIAIFKTDGRKLSMHKGGNPENEVRRLFRDARAAAPALLFIDELHLVARVDGEGGKSPSLCADLTAVLIEELDKLREAQVKAAVPDKVTGKAEPMPQVVVVGVTEQADQLTENLLRKGRFDRTIELTKPEWKGRLAILKLKTKSMKLTQDVDLDYIAQNTQGMTGADLLELCNRAGVLCAREYIASALGAEEKDAAAAEEYVDYITIPLEIKMDGQRIWHKHFVAALKESGLQDEAGSSKVKWDDIGGYDKVKRKLIRALDYPLRYPKILAKFGKAGMAEGVLLFGPSGCGKTLLAEAVAEQLQANFVCVRGPEILSAYFGKSASNVRDIFNKARANAPCILFFEELEVLGRSRKSGPNSDASGDQVLNQLLLELDGIGKGSSGSDQVLVMAATNRVKQVDPALLRPGRFGMHIEIGPPNEEARIGVFTALLRGTPLSPDVTPEVLAALAAATEGMTGADISLICNRARMFAVERIVARGGELEETDSVTAQDLQAAQATVDRPPPPRPESLEKPEGEAEDTPMVETGASVEEIMDTAEDPDAELS
jgi:transitional endoplasmic reticulum ATPase